MSFRRIALALVCVPLLLIAYIISSREAIEDEQRDTSIVKKKELKKTAADWFSLGGFFRGCKPLCKDLKDYRMEYFKGDLLNVDDIVKLVTQARENAIDVLKSHYGEEYYSKIFQQEEGVTIGRTDFFAANGKSWERMKRKLMLKLLEVQIAIMDEEGDGCNTCKVNADEEEEDYEEMLYSAFVWATGGHSAAAAHGNIFNESYTAELERIVRPLFEAVGIEFEARNYAMGGVSSGVEVAFCSEAIFGSDIDAISWDFGMTDNHIVWRLLVFFSRAALNPGRPAFVLLNAEESWTSRLQQMKDLEDAAMTSIVMRNDAISKALDAVPDSFGLSDEQLANLPTHVRSFKCKQSIETGDPFCGDQKYSSMCPDRYGKTSWHPGWKWHSLIGSMLSLFLMEALLDAAKELQKLGDDPRTLFETLKAQEDADYDTFFASPLQAGATSSQADWPCVNMTAHPDFDLATLFRSPSVCHTGLLPAETRYRGILTDRVEAFGFDKGIAKNEADKIILDRDGVTSMPLVYDPEAHKDEKCEATVDIDFKDYFYVSDRHGWRTLVVPNQAEKRVYLNGDTSRLKGFVAVCFGLCDWGRCPPGTISVDGILQGDAAMEVNGKPVIDFMVLDKCHGLLGDDGYYWPPNEDGLFELKVRVTASNSFIRISSVVVF